MAKKPDKAPPATRGIEDTLRDLDIDKDIDPEDAARQAADKASEETPPLEPQGQIKIPAPTATEEDDDEEPEDRETKRGLTGSARNVMLPDDDDDDDDDEDFLPRGAPAGMPLVPPPSMPRGPRGKTRDKAPIGSGKLSKGLADKVPGADKMKVYKRINGQRWFIREYTKADLNQFTDFESFLTRYVKPAHGAGEYDLVGVDGLSRDIEVGQIRLIEESSDKPSESSTAIGLVEHVMKEQRERDEKWMARMLGGQQNPLDLLTGVMALKKELDGESGGAQAAAAKAQADASSSTMQMMMLMMQQQQQSADRQNQLMMTLLSKPREEDPIMKLLLTKMLSEGSLGGGGGAPPPPPPPVKATDGLADILTAMAAFMGSMGGGGGDDDFKDFLKTMITQKQGEQLGIKDIIELLGVKKDSKDEFTSAIDHMAAIMNLTNNVRQQQEPGAAAGFFDALAALFANRDFAGSIAQTIRSKTDKTANVTEARLQAEGQRVAMESRLVQQERNRLAAAGTIPPPPRNVPQVTTQQAQKAAERVVERTGRLPEIPANTYEHVNNILGAKDEADQVGKTLAMLIYFAEFDDWKPFTERILGMIRDGRKTESLKYLVAFFEGLSAIGLLPEESGKGVVQVLGKHFAIVQSQLVDLTLAADGQVTGEQLVAAPEAAAPGG